MVIFELPSAFAMKIRPIPPRSIFEFTITLIMLAGLAAAQTERVKSWSLDEALARVRSANPDARAAAARMRAALAGVEQTRAAWLPKLMLDAGYQAGDRPTMVFMSLLDQRQYGSSLDVKHPPVRDDLGAEARLEYPIFTGGARSSAFAMARAGEAAARYDWEATTEGLELEVAKAYYRVHQAREMVVAARAEEASYQSHLGVAQAKVAAQDALRTAVLDLEARLASAGADVAAAEASRNIAREYLRLLLGIGTEASFEVSDVITPLAEPKNPGIGSRKEQLAMAMKVRQTRAAVDLAAAEAKPKVVAFVSGRNDSGLIDSGNGASWTAGVGMKWDIWSGGENRARVAQAKARVAEAEAMAEKQDLEMLFEIRQARLNLDTARKRLALAEKAVKSAAESAEVTRQRFAEGLSLSTQLIDSQSALTSAQVMRAQARAEEMISIAVLRHALGLPIRGREAGK